jgi:hypothetical protein
MAGYAPLPLKLAVSLAQAVAAVAMRQQNPTSASVAGEEGRKEGERRNPSGGWERKLHDRNILLFFFPFFR